MKLTIDRLREVVSYDAESGVFRWKVRNARRLQIGDVAGRVTGRYLGFAIDYEPFLAHRLAWMYVHGEMPATNIDHINRDSFDNRLANLRLADQSENLQNKGMQRNNKTGVTGVMFDRRRGNYRAEIAVSGKKYYLGRFSTVDAAADAYAAAKSKLHPFSTGANRISASSLVSGNRSIAQQSER